jgi:flagellin
VNTADLGAQTLTGNAVSSTAFTDLTTASALTINGLSVSIGEQDDIDGVIDAINNESGETGATAKKNTETVVTDTGFIALTTAGATQTLTLNSVTISLTTGNAAANSTFIATVNGFTDQTGVVAATNSVGITFTRASGGTISMSETTASVGVGDSVASTADRTFNAGFTLSVDLDASLSVVSSDVGIDLGFTTSVVSTSATENRINGISIANASDSNDAISTIDYALAQLNQVRGDIGAVQNRFSSAISSLSVASENLSAARSRIQDADVAQETAQLTRNQILIQAGVSVLAQANQLPSVALSLLGR